VGAGRRNLKKKKKGRKAPPVKTAGRELSNCVPLKGPKLWGLLNLPEGEANRKKKRCGPSEGSRASPEGGNWRRSDGFRRGDEEENRMTETFPIDKKPETETF